MILNSLFINVLKNKSINNIKHYFNRTMVMQSFKGYIIEMASTEKQGFQYEINAVKVL